MYFCLRENLRTDVTGRMENQFFDGRVLEADSVVTLSSDAGKRAGL